MDDVTLTLCINTTWYHHLRVFLHRKIFICLSLNYCWNIWQERAERMGIDPSKGVPNWAWQTNGQVNATPVPPFSTAASSGFSISATFPSTAIFPTKSMNPIPQSFCFTSHSTPGSNAPQFYYEVKSSQAPSQPLSCNTSINGSPPHKFWSSILKTTVKTFFFFFLFAWFRDRYNVVAHGMFVCDEKIFFFREKVKRKNAWCVLKTKFIFYFYFLFNLNS